VEPVDRTARAKKRREVRAHRRAMLRDICLMCDQGMSPAEITGVTGLTASQIRSYISKSGMPRQRGNKPRRLCGFVNSSAMMTIRNIADAAQVEPRVIVSRLLAILAEDNGRAAVKLLGKQALPKQTNRGYREASPPRGKRVIQHG
jgi:hypothetical protein